MEKTSTKVKKSKLGVSYIKSTYNDFHHCKPDRSKLKKKELIDKSFQEDIIHFHKNTPVKFIKNFMKNKQRSEMEVSYGKVWYELNKRGIKYKENDANILIERLTT